MPFIIPSKLLRSALALMLFALMATTAYAETWTIDPPHSAAHFSIRHMMIAQVRGMFPDIKGTIVFDGDTPTAFDVTINVNSLDTGVEKRDKHLLSKDFFEAETYPVMTFKSSKVAPVGDEFQVTGTLTIKSVSQEVTLIFTGLDEKVLDPWNAIRRGGMARFRIDRRDYNIDWNALLEGGGIMVGNEVSIIVDLEVLKP